MKLDWRFHERKELEHDKPPSVWIAVAITVLVCVAGFVLTVLTWEKGQPVVSMPFFTRALLAPLAMSGFLCALVYVGHEDSTDYVNTWNYLCRRSRVRWQAWSQGCVAILESIALTPEKDLAERMLGLEGSEPRNEGKMLPLYAAGETDAPEADTAVVQSGGRLESILEKLVTPFVPYMVRAADRHTFSIVLQSDDEADIDTLRTLLRRLDVPNADRIGIERPARPFDAGLVHRWLNDEEKMPDFCLVLACQLHKDGAQAKFSEAATGVLFVPEHVIGQFRGELRAHAYLFQPVSAATDSVANALRGMFTAQRTPPESVQHLWLSSLPRQARHAAVAAASGAGLSAAAHDVELAIGVAGPANALLAQALAAEMVQHGQGAQLVATSGGAGIVLNLVGMHLTPVPAKPVFTVRYLRPVRMLAAGCLSSLIGFVLDITNAPGGLFVLVPAVFLFIVLFDAFASRDEYDEIEDDFN